MKPCPVCQSRMHELGGLWICDFCKHEEEIMDIAVLKTSFYEVVAEALF